MSRAQPKFRCSVNKIITFPSATNAKKGVYQSSPTNSEVRYVLSGTMLGKRWLLKCTEIKSTTQRIGWRAKNCGRTRSFPEMSLSRHTASRRVLDFQLVWSMFINSCTICFLGYMVVTGLSCLRMPFAWRTSRPIFWVEVFLKLPASDATVDPFLLIGTLVPHRVPFFTKKTFQIFIKRSY